MRGNSVAHRVGRVAGAFSLLAAASLSPGVARAQTTTGNIRGYVTGAGGTPISDATVSARNVDMGAQRGTQTNASGFYNIAGLRPGTYELAVRRIGFSPQTRAVQVQIGATLTADLQLAEAATQLSAVTVTATTAATETQTSERATNVSREQIQNLPLFERNVLDLARLAPGVSASAVNSTDKTFAAGGQPADAVNVFLDGASYKSDVLSGGVAGQNASKGNPFPQGAIQEFRIVTQNYKAEYQKAGSAIISATTRSGTNQWEGDAFAYGVAKGYAAKDAFTARRGGDRPVYQRLQAGGNIGGPLIKDKLFLFGTYELNFRDEPAYILFHADSANYPLTLRDSLRQYLGQQAQQFREHLGFGKLTWQQSERSTLDVSANVRHDADFRGFGGQTAFQAAENLAIHVYSGVANWKYAGDKWLNEAQINGQNYVWNPKPRDATVIGRNYENLLRIGGKDTRQQFTQNRISLRDDITRSGVNLAGDHVFKGGATVDFLSYESIKDFNYNPVFTYNAGSYTAAQAPFRVNFGFGDPRIHTNNTQFGGYVQDDWAIGRRLVLNLGLRWDAETNMINNGYVTPAPLADTLRSLYTSGQLFLTQELANGTQDRNIIGELGGINRYITSGRSDRSMYLGAWQPRIGGSYDVFGNTRTVVFGGWGLYYDRDNWNTFLDEQFRRQHAVLEVLFNDVGATPDCPRCVQWDPKYYDPAQLRTLAGTAGLPEVFLVANDLKPPRTQQFSGGVRQGLGSYQLTLSYNGIRGSHFSNFVRGANSSLLAPNYAALFVTDDRVKTWYDAVQLQIDRPLLLGNRWGGSLAYTLGRADEQGQSTDIFWPFDPHFPIVPELPRRRAPNNQVHTVVANAIVQLPYDIRVASLVTLGSGLTSNAVDQRPGSGFGREINYVFEPPTKPFLGLGHVFNTQDLDLRLEKGLTLVSGQRAAFVVDLFNALNTANYGCYDTTIHAPSPDPGVNSNANLGKPSCAGLGRRIQLGLRYGFSARRNAMGS